jgi:hypothetical protein
MKREDYIRIALKAGFDVTPEGTLYLYNDSKMLMKPNYQGTLVDGLKAMMDIAYEEGFKAAKQIEKVES